MIRIELVANGVPIPGSATELPWDTLGPGAYVCFNPSNERMQAALRGTEYTSINWPEWLDVSVRCLPTPDPETNPGECG